VVYAVLHGEESFFKTLTSLAHEAEMRKKETGLFTEGNKTCYKPLG
jgi:hypothetical protein